MADNEKRTLSQIMISIFIRALLSVLSSDLIFIFASFIMNIRPKWNIEISGIKWYIGYIIFGT